MKRRPPTKLIRIRVRDLKLMKILSKEEKKYLPDLQTEIIKYYKKNKK